MLGMDIIIHFGINMNYIGNRNGIPLIDASLTTAGTESTAAVYIIPNHTFRFVGNAGLVVVNLDSATSTANSINFQTNNGQVQTLTGSTGAALTTITTGLHIVLFNKHTNKLSLIV